MTSYQTNQEAIATEETTINHVEIIENVIDTLEQDDSAMVNHNAEGGILWKFKYGSVEVFVQLAGNTDEDTLTVWSVVLKLPAKDEPNLMRRLLEMNCSSTFEARFGIIENQVVVIAIRTLADLSAGEASRLITIVASIADNNDDALQAEFGLS
ncbi:YbjN domain-containing protein [Scytonema hofmannii FACHB-248]|uniref:YbjN domain-containing protein n=1 Tax=Scytonema hofmannii FACHB-248 TaxID=1842502 RepID=A0ABR8GZS1_9CYAN|nr:MULTISPECIES: YbjN domain-containing protein [Nostocales]MBD2608678.1 YbjN domain-containing protein [Scytonema hofmannii FACHB-248]